MNKYIYASLFSGLLLAGCTANGPLFHSWGEYDNEQTENGIYRVEEPYEIKGVVYAPAEVNEYSEKGLASWYIPSGDSALTANGEVYDVNIPSARHKTLPLPSIVKITNLENNKSIITRVNDRGPMVNSRLIDVSQAAAHELAMPVSGTALVQVDLMPKESAELKNYLVNQGRVYQSSLMPTPEPEKSVPQDETELLIVPPADTVSMAEPLYNGQEKQTEQVRPVVVPNGPSIQLGSFADKSNAEKLKSRLQGQFPVYFTDIERNGQTLTVVKAGPFTDKTMAQQSLTLLKQQGFKDAYITK